MKRIFEDRACATCGKIYRQKNKSNKFCSNICYQQTRKGTRHKELTDANIWFWPRVTVAEGNDCWHWTGILDEKGYGRITRFWPNGQYEYAHRIAFLLKNGRFANGVTRHTCDNKSCCNPSHLIEGTIKDNIHDYLARHKTKKGRKSGSVNFTNETIIRIRESPEKHSVLAAHYNVSDSTILRIRQRKLWKHV